MKARLLIQGTLLCALIGAVIVAAGVPGPQRVDASEAPDPDAIRARGEHLVNTGHCNDCHTPWVMGPAGPQPDPTRLLSGHPASYVMPPPPELPAGPWAGLFSDTNTAWAGPWGVSFTANLTPDPETGLGRWTEEDFVATIRGGRHLGRGRELLPPMPWQNVAMLSDADLHAVFTYLRSIPAVENRVPEPLPPAGSR